MPNVAIRDTGKLVHLVLEAGPPYFTKTIAFWAQALSEADKLAELGSCMTPLWSIDHRANLGARLQSSDLL